MRFVKSVKDEEEKKEDSFRINSHTLKRGKAKTADAYGCEISFYTKD
jgi:hypothetical protein